MGNCIQRSSSAAAAENIDKTPSATAGGPPCDEQGTVDSSFAASPPSSPLSKSASGAELRRDDPAAAESQHPLQISGGDASLVEQHREEGQRRLRELVVSGASAGEFDWKSIIALAEDLHRKEQQLLRSYNTNSEGVRKNISRRQAFFEKRRRAKERARRRKLESVGSFSVNLLAYDPEGHCRKDDCVLPPEKSIEDEDNDASNTVSIESGDEDALDESRESDESDEIDVFEDDVLPDAACPLGRPGTPLPFVTPPPIIVNDGSFMAATSLFGAVEEEEEESSESESDNMSSMASRGNNDWDLMTIDENATVSFGD